MDVTLKGTFVNLANKAMNGFQNPLIRDIVDYGLNIM